MSLVTMGRVRRTARIAYLQHPVARLYRIGRHAIGGDGEGTIGDVLVLPLAGLALSLFLLSIPGASDAVASACSLACMP